MSLFMDVHNIDGGVSAEDVAGAHMKDLETQGKYGVSYLRYWVDEEAGKIFCLVEAGGAEDANTGGPRSRRRRDLPGQRAQLKPRGERPHAEDAPPPPQLASPN